MGEMDFEVEIRSAGGRDFEVAVINSPVGEARSTMRFPYDELALKVRLQALELALIRSGGTRRKLPSPEEASVRDFGRDLFDALIHGDVRSRFDASMAEARRQGKPLRVNLRFDSPALAALPWEFLFDTRRSEYLVLSSNTPLARYIELPEAVRPLAVTGPLRVLGMIASPSDLPELDVQREKLRIQEATADLQARGLLEISWLEPATWRTLQQALRREKWHIFHFVGHGGFDANTDEGLVAFVDDAGAAYRLPATELARLLGDHDPLRLAVLNACEGARGSDHDLFSSTAATLVRRGTPAVVAMQYEITDRAAIEFSRSFYEAVADGLPVDLAMADARKAVSLAINNTLEWGTPVLFMRSGDGMLFKVRPGKARDVQTPVAAASTVLSPVPAAAPAESPELVPPSDSTRPAPPEPVTASDSTPAAPPEPAPAAAAQVEEEAPASTAAGPDASGNGPPPPIGVQAPVEPPPQFAAPQPSVAAMSPPPYMPPGTTAFPPIPPAAPPAPTAVSASDSGGRATRRVVSRPGLIGAAVVVFVLAVGIAAFVILRTPEPTITFVPNHGVPGDVIHISGTGFQAGEVVRILGMDQTLATVTVGTDGSFFLDYTFGHAGQFVVQDIQAVGATSGRTAKGVFGLEVGEASTPSPPAGSTPPPAETLTPSETPPPTEAPTPPPAETLVPTEAPTPPPTEGISEVPWQNLSGGLRSGPGVSSAGLNRMDAFILSGTSLQLWQRTLRTPAWNDWHPIATNTLASDPSAASWPGGRIDVFARGTDDQIYQITAPDGDAWGDWYPFPEAFTFAPCSDPPRCAGPRAAFGAGRLHVFAQALDGTLWHDSTTDGTAWAGWESLGGDSVDSGVATVAWNDGQMDIYGRGEDGVIWHDHYDGSAWTGWVRFIQQMEQLAACDPTATCPGPAVTSPDAGRLDLFIEGADGTLYMDEWLDRSWHGWVQLGTNLVVSDPVASALRPGRLDIFTRLTTSSDLYHRFLEGGTWVP